MNMKQISKIANLAHTSQTNQHEKVVLARQLILDALDELQAVVDDGRLVGVGKVDTIRRQLSVVNNALYGFLE